MTMKETTVAGVLGHVHPMQSSWTQYAARFAETMGDDILGYDPTAHVYTLADAWVCFSLTQDTKRTLVQIESTTCYAELTANYGELPASLTRRIQDTVRVFLGVD